MLLCVKKVDVSPMLTRGEEALYRKMSNHKEIAKGNNGSESRP